MMPAAIRHRETVSPSIKNKTLNNRSLSKNADHNFNFKNETEYLKISIFSLIQ